MAYGPTSSMPYMPARQSGEPKLPLPGYNKASHALTWVLSEKARSRATDCSPNERASISAQSPCHTQRIGRVKTHQFFQCQEVALHRHFQICTHRTELPENLLAT